MSNAPDFPQNPASLAKSGNVLSAIRVSSHDNFYDGLYTIFSDDPELYKIQFDILLGGYCNALTLVKFLETGLSVACMCVKYAELDYTRHGDIEFKVILPSIAKSNLDAATKPTYLFVTKRISRETLRATFTITNEAIRLLTGDSLDETKLSEFERQTALNQLVQNVQVTVDSFERGTINQVLEFLMAKAPPTPILKCLNLYIDQTNSFDKVTKANIVSCMKKNLKNEYFFMDKNGNNQLFNRIVEIISATRPSITVPQITHVAPNGAAIDGVLVSTEYVRDRLLGMREYLYATEAKVPSTYANLMIDGSNLVTAISMGKAVNNFQDFAKNILDFKGEQAMINRELSKSIEGQATITVPANIMAFSNKLVFLEALESIYRSTGTPYPLVTDVDFSFFMPLGIHKPAIDRYPGKGNQVISGNSDRLYPPTKIFFYNKDQVMVDLKLEDALGTVCHPLTLNMSFFTQSFDDIPEIPVFPANITLLYSRRSASLSLQVMEFLRALKDNRNYITTDSHLINRMTTEQFFKSDNVFLQLERSPFFDFFMNYFQIPDATDRIFVESDNRILGHSLRYINGNIPLPLLSTDFRNCRGEALAASTYCMSPESVKIIQSTFDDANYPPVLYIIESAIHGNEVIFLSSLRLVAACINSYWTTNKGVAFINNFSMISFIVSYLGTGELPAECLNVYREVIFQIQALRDVIMNLTLPTTSNLQHHEQQWLNNLLEDPMLIAPVIYDMDSFKTKEYAQIKRYRDARYNYGGQPVTITTARRDMTTISWVPGNEEEIKVYHQGANEKTAHKDNEWLVQNKIFYYVIVPAFSKGKCCTVAANYQNVYTLLTNLDPKKTSTKKSRTSLNTLLNNYNINFDEEVIKEAISFSQTPAGNAHIINYHYKCDPGMRVNFTRDDICYDTTLHNGIILMQYPKRDRLINLKDFFSAVPINTMYANRNIIAATHSIDLSSLDSTVPIVPTICGSDRFRAVRYPMACYAATSKAPTTTLIFGILGCYFKLGPVAFIHQFKNGFHSGLAFTIVRQDRFAADQILYSEKASEGLFFGGTEVTKLSDPNGLALDINQSRAHVDLGLGFTATMSSAHLQCPITDMGNLPQNLFNTRSMGDFYNSDTTDFVKRFVCCKHISFPNTQTPFLNNHMSIPETPAMERGQPSTNEFIITPVTSDLGYFRVSADPRGRSGCVITCKDYSDSAAERLFYDHTIPDPAFPFRATNNPWASQKYSVNDVIYNPEYNLQLTHNAFYSPCSKFFNSQEIISKNKSLLKMISEYSRTMSRTTDKTDYQFSTPACSEELIRDPCSFFQETFPALCCTDTSLFQKYQTNIQCVNSYDENYYSSYLIEDDSPLQGILSKIQ